MLFKDTMIIDFTRLLPGPYATSFFVSLGAEVIKIEEPGKGDYMRDYGTVVNGTSAMFDSLNKGKKSISIDLYDDEKEKLIELIKKADILIESFRPGFMKKIGLDYESVKLINPKIIYCSITGFGQTGSLADMAGHDLNYLSYSGLLDVLMKGEKEKRAEDYIPAIQITDIGASLNAVIALLVAYINRIQTGQGQYIDISIVDGIYSNCMQLVLPEYIAAQKEPNAMTNSLYGKFANYCIYNTKDRRKLCVAAIEKKFWEIFCKTIDRSDLIGCLSDDNKMMSIQDEIQNIIIEKTLAEWMEIFEKKDACVSPVVELNEVGKFSQVLEHDLFNVETGEIYIPINFSTIEMKRDKRSPRLGEHNREYI